MAWARWLAGAAPGHDGERLWDFENRYGDTFTSEACSGCKAICSNCPQPRLLPAAQRAAGAFLLCRSQWNYAPSGLPSGLRYGDCMRLLRQRAGDIGADPADLPTVMAQLQEIEWAFRQGCLEVFKARQEQRNGG